MSIPTVAVRQRNRTIRRGKGIKLIALFISLPCRVHVTTLWKPFIRKSEEVKMAIAKNAVPDGYHTVTPQLTLDNAAQAIDWYKKALGAEEGGRAVGPDGKIMHSELRVGDSRIMVNDAMMGGKGPRTLGGSPASLWIYVEDCDALFNRAVAAGAEVAKGPMGRMADQFWGDRCGTFTDPEGYRWTIATHKEDLSPEELEQRQADFMKQFAAQPTQT
jgi:PhnB protein